ncbi:MAG: sugar phosphate isomerase/epimerase family protein [Alphaproteobacteria bacterium]
MMRHLQPKDCAINTATLGFQAPIGHVIEAVARSGFGAIAPWRREVEGRDVKAIARQIRHAGLMVPGYCRSTYIPARDNADFNANVEANRRAISDAGVLGAKSFVMVVGGLPEGSRDISAAREQVAEAAGLLLPHAKACGVRLALEPLHPVYAASRSCLSLLSEALDMCEAVEGSVDDAWLGVCIDVYHVWWDPNLRRDIARSRGRILGFHVCDWLVPTVDVLNDRGMMGDGVIDVRAIRGDVEAAGFEGFTEVEIFSATDWGKRPMDETLAACRERLAAAT